MSKEMCTFASLKEQKVRTMEEQIISLQKTIETLSASVASLSKANTEQAENNRKLVEQNEKLVAEVKNLTAQIAWLKRKLFGQTSEKKEPYDPSMDLFSDYFKDQEQQIEPAKEEAEKKIGKDSKEDRKQAKKNRQMLEGLPVLETETLEPEGIDLSKYRRIGEEITQVIEHKPGMLYIRQIIRPRYALINDGIELPAAGERMVAIAPMPLLPIYRGMAGPSLLAELLLQKYEYHMPFYRQIQELKHLGMRQVSESTVDGWFSQTASLLKPLYNVLKEEVMKSDYNQADETTIPVMDREKHKAVKEYLWMVRAVMERLVVFYYEDGSRAGAVIKELSKKFKGYLQCDGFVGYETAFKTNPAVLLVHCMAHIRRDFEQALNENKGPAEHALKEIQFLYRIEQLCDQDPEMTPEKRKEKRQELAKPIMLSMKAWMESEGIKYGEKTSMGKAITYAYTRWDNMMRYLDDGRIHIDNNLAENAIRPITLGRKNYLFCGNHAAAENMAVICSLLATCKAHDVNPRDYLNDIIAKMPYMKDAKPEILLELLPHKWKLQHPDSIIKK